MEIILKDADFSQTGLIEPITAQLQQGKVNVLTGGMSTGTTTDFNRTVDVNYYDRRTTIKNIGSATFNFLIMFYDANKDYIGYGTMDNTHTESESLVAKSLSVDDSFSIYDFVRYLDVSGGSWSSNTFNPEDAKYFRIYMENAYSASLSAQLSK